FFQAEDGIRDLIVTGFRRVLFRSRFDLGIGRGDSARRVLGKPPTTLAVLEEATRVIKELAEGRPVTYEDKTIQLEWAPKHRLPRSEERRVGKEGRARWAAWE